MIVTKVLVINGSNLNYLGKREPEVYGEATLVELEQKLVQVGANLNIEVECFQSNHEGEILDRLYRAKEDGVTGVILNAGAFTHTSIALCDCIKATLLPVVEVHLSNVYKREEFRHKSYIAPVSIGQIVGFGTYGYELGLLALKQRRG